ncbi:sensor histidine kinase, partial [bacterium]|nr:sensor histidine kinase [bacterium]
LDLRDWDLTNDGILNISGEWEFYWNQLLIPEDIEKLKQTDRIEACRTGFLKMPGSWKGYLVNGETLPGDGYATFRLRVLMNSQEDPLAFYLKYINSAFKLYINGQEITSQGVVGKEPRSSKPSSVRSKAVYTPSEGQMDILLQVSNYHLRKGGILSPVVLGYEKDIREKRETGLALDLILIGSFIVMAFYHFWLYLIRRKERSPFYFWLFCLLVALFTSLMNEKSFSLLFPGASFEMEYFLLYSTLVFSIPLFYSFTHSLYPRETSKFYLIVIYGFSLTSFGVVIFAGVRMASEILPYYLLLVLISIVYISKCIITAIKRKREGSLVLFAGFLVFGLSVVNDVFNEYDLIHTNGLVALGLFVLIFSEALLFSLRSAKAFTKVETISKELEKQNIILKREIAERKQAEKELWMASKQANAANQAKTEFLANISHELRTPMHGILAYSKKGIKKMDLVSQDKLFHYFSQINTAGNRLMILLNNLLDLSKLESGKVDYQMERQDINKLIQVIVSDFASAAEEKDQVIEIQENVKSNIATFDWNKIGQVLSNLILNAIKYTPDGKKITISMEESQIDIKNEKSPAVKIQVKDQGVGIPNNELELVFDKFIQSSKTNTGAGGTGLGLSICKEIVESHGGVIWAEHNPEGQGSIFVFKLHH